jgi:TonB family protein
MDIQTQDKMKHFLNVAVVCAMAWTLVCATTSVGAARQPQTPPPENQTAPSLSPISSPEIDELVARFVPEIKNMRLKTVAVFGAQGPGENLTMLGYSIGDAVTESLARQADGFRVVDRSALRERIKKEQLHESELLSAALDGWISELVKADAILFVRIETLKAPNMTLALSLFNAKAKAQKAVAGASTQITVDEKQADASRHSAILEADINRVGHIPHSSSGEFDGKVTCVSCPRPDMSSEARNDMRGGEVWLEAIVMRDGKVDRVWVTKSGGRGLDQKAVEAVRKWLFKPAKDENGNPVACIATIQVQFEIYNGPFQ